MPVKTALLIPILIAVTFMMESLESAMLATALPTIARDLHTDPIQAGIALTTYFLVTAALIPLSGWLSDRFGHRTVFCNSIVLYSLGSLLCAVAPTMHAFLGGRVLQGAAGALMFTIGRIILVTSVSKKDIVRASSLLTIPSALAPVIGPLVAGYLATYSDWRFLFLVNIPFSLLSFLLAIRFIPRSANTNIVPFDGLGFALSGAAMIALGFGFNSLGVYSTSLGAGLLVIGTATGALYVQHARHRPAPIIDLSLLRYHTFRIAVGSSFIVRAGVVGALPFLLPMMLQTGFGLTAFESGSITFIGAIALLATKFIVTPALRLTGFRSFLMGTSLMGALTLLLLAFVSKSTPSAIIMAILFVGALVRVLQILGLESIIFAEVPSAEMSSASSFLSVVKQLSASVGAAYGGLALYGAQSINGHVRLEPADFRMAMIMLAVPLLTTVWLASRLSHGDGDEIAGRVAAAP